MQRIIQHTSVAGPETRQTSHGAQIRRKKMVISTNLECWLCHRAYRLTLEIYASAQLGSPHFWCRECCAPRTLTRMLKKLIAEAKSVRKLNDYDLAAVNKILAKQDGGQTPARSLYEQRWDADRPETEQNEVSAEGEVLELADAV